MHNETCPETAVAPASLEQLERQLIALLYAIWRAQGKSKRVVEIKKDMDNEQERNQHFKTREPRD